MAVIYRDLIAESIRRGLEGATPLGGSGVVIMKGGMPVDSRSGQLTDTIIVPYWGHFGRAQKLPLIGGALTPTNISATEEKATVEHFGKAWFEQVFNRLASIDDPWPMMQEMARELFTMQAEESIIAIASQPLAGNTNLYSTYSAVTPKYYDLRTDVKAKQLLGDEADRHGGFILRAVHSTVWADLELLTDDAGNPLVSNVVQGTDTLRYFNGIRTVVTDLLPVDTTNPSLPKYTSLLFKRNSTVFWATDPYFDSDKDILAMAEIGAVDWYSAAHRYKFLNGGTKPGVVVVHTNGDRPEA